MHIVEKLDNIGKYVMKIKINYGLTKREQCQLCLIVFLGPHLTTLSPMTCACNIYMIYPFLKGNKCLRSICKSLWIRYH